MLSRPRVKQGAPGARPQRQCLIRDAGAENQFMRQIPKCPRAWLCGITCQQPVQDGPLTCPTGC